MPIKGTRPAGRARARGVREGRRRARDDRRPRAERPLARLRDRAPSLAGADGASGRWRASSTSSRSSRGRCARTSSLTELLEATFPGGSVTGAPKIAAIDHIAALEPVGRGASMGALGTIRPNGDFDLALTIRTFAVAEGRIHLWVGGGIVWDSDPDGGDRGVVGEGAAAARRRSAPRCARAGRGHDACARRLRAGSRRPDEPVIHVDDEAFMRGRGAFETMRVYGGRPFRLADHLDRLAGSCARLGVPPPPRADVGGLVRLALAAAARRTRCSASTPRRGRRSGRCAIVVVAALPPDLDELRARGIRADLRRVPAGRPDRRRQVDELRAEHDRRRRGAGGGRRRRGVPRRGRHRPRGDDLERLVAGRRARVHAGGRARHPRRRDAERAPRARRGRSATRWRRGGSPSPSWRRPTRRSRRRRFAR